MPYSDKERKNDWNRKKNAEFREQLNSYKEANPCTDCEEHFPHYVMEFDHTRGEKRYNIGSMASKRFGSKLFNEELAKCDLVCANCHSTRTWHRRQHFTRLK